MFLGNLSVKTLFFNFILIVNLRILRKTVYSLIGDI